MLVSRCFVCGIDLGYSYEETTRDGKDFCSDECVQEYQDMSDIKLELLILSNARESARFDTAELSVDTEDGDL